MPLTAEAALAKDRRHRDDPVMQHRHYAVVAGVIATIKDTATRNATAVLFADALRQTNPHFNRIRFLRACDYEVGSAGSYIQTK